MVERRPGLRTRVRAELVSLRTLHRRVDVVDTTARGDPVVVVGEERLVLPPHARHFRRFVSCALCGDEFLGPAPVLSIDQLDTPSMPAVCMACARPSPLPPDA